MNVNTTTCQTLALIIIIFLWIPLDFLPIIMSSVTVRVTLLTFPFLRPLVLFIVLLNCQGTPGKGWTEAATVGILSGSKSAVFGIQHPVMFVAKLQQVPFLMWRTFCFISISGRILSWIIFSQLKLRQVTLMKESLPVLNGRIKILQSFIKHKG